MSVNISNVTDLCCNQSYLSQEISRIESLNTKNGARKRDVYNTKDGARKRDVYRAKGADPQGETMHHKPLSFTYASRGNSIASRGKTAKAKHDPRITIAPRSPVSRDIFDYYSDPRIIIAPRSPLSHSIIIITHTMNPKREKEQYVVSNPFPTPILAHVIDSFQGTSLIYRKETNLELSNQNYPIDAIIVRTIRNFVMYQQAIAFHIRETQSFHTYLTFSTGFINTKGKGGRARNMTCYTIITRKNIGINIKPIHKTKVEMNSMNKDMNYSPMTYNNDALFFLFNTSISKFKLKEIELDHNEKKK
eukprot:50947_1